MEDLHAGINFVTHSDIEIVEADGDRAVGRVEIAEYHQQPYGIVHGGVYCTLVETLASTGAALWAISEGMVGCVGVSNMTDFYRATREGVIVGEATPIHRGRTQQVWQVVITRQGDRKMVARGQVRLQNLADDSLINQTQ